MGEAKRRSRAQREWEALGDRRLGDAPVEEQYHANMSAVAAAVDEFFNGDDPDRKVGFVLMVFPIAGFDGRCNYMSNGIDRRDIVTLMKEMIARFEGQPEVEGRA